MSCILLFCAAGAAQETVFNVPSGDVLERGKIYGELDVTEAPEASSGSFTPRVVAGVGRGVEVGLNLDGLVAPGPVETILAPTVKWKLYEDGTRGWAVLTGDDLFLPVQRLNYAAGNYLYAEFAKTWKTKTRATAGAYWFTRGVVAAGSRAGGQFAIEQPAGARVTLAGDWFTGNHALGYATPGIIVKLTSKLTGYLSYQLGNAGLSRGNHQFLFEMGWNFN